MSLRDQLHAIYDQHGKLTPELVVDEAREPSHPLHGRFEWDDKVAGEAWRREQAHDLIRSVRVIYREATEKEQARTVRAFHAVRTDEGHVYQPVERVADNPLLRKLVVQDMERQWKELFRRFGEFEEFLAMVQGDIGDKAA